MTAVQALLQIYTEESIRQVVTDVRRDPKQLDRITCTNWRPNDPTRQTFRRAIRWLAETPDVQWPSLKVDPQ